MLFLLLFDSRYKRTNSNIKYVEVIFSTDFTNREKKNLDAIFQFSPINYILKSHSDFEFLRKSLNVVLNDKILTQIEHDLRRCLRTKTFYVMFYLKKHYRNFIDESVEIIEQSLKTKKKERIYKKNLSTKNH